MTTVNACNTDEIEEISYQLGNLSLAALTCGDKTKQPILCLHGYLDNAASFIPLMKASALSNYYIIALEWPGHGHSDHRSDGAHYHFLDYVSDLVTLFSVNQWPAIDIVAHSMGAMVASAFAAAFPEKVKSLTLIDSFGFICTPVEQTTAQLREGLLSRQKIAITNNSAIEPVINLVTESVINSDKNSDKSSNKNSGNQARSFSKETAVKARMLASDLTNEHAKLLVERSLMEVSTETSNDLANHKVTSTNNVSTKKLYRWRADPRLRAISPYRMSLAQGQQLFNDIKCPLQLIYGDKGMDMVSSGLANFSASNKAHITKLVGGHHVHMEQANALSSTILAFLE